MLSASFYQRLQSASIHQVPLGFVTVCLTIFLVYILHTYTVPTVPVNVPPDVSPHSPCSSCSYDSCSSLCNSCVYILHTHAIPTRLPANTSHQCSSLCSSICSSPCSSLSPPFLCAAVAAAAGKQRVLVGQSAAAAQSAGVQPGAATVAAPAPRVAPLPTPVPQVAPLATPAQVAPLDVQHVTASQTAVLACYHASVV